MFIELTEANKVRLLVNKNHISIITPSDIGCKIYVVDMPRALDISESYADVVFMLSPRREETDQNVIEVLEAVTEQLEDIGTQYQKEIVRAALAKARQ